LSLARPLKWPPVFPLEKGLVLWLPFDDRSGSRALDRSGKLNHGTLYGPTWAAGRRGSVLRFDGVDDYVNVPHSSNINLNSSFTINFWVKIITFIEGSRLLQKREWQDCFYDVGMTNHHVFLAIKDGVTYIELDGTVTIDDEQWHHVVCIRDTESNLLLLYMDGTFDVSMADTTTGSITNTEDLKIGARIAGNQYSNSIIDEVRIYNRALNAAEVKRLHESTLMLARH